MRRDNLGSTVAILFAILFTNCPAADLPAFPGAEAGGWCASAPWRTPGQARCVRLSASRPDRGS